MSWRTFIETAGAGDHGVHVYARPEELVESVGGYLAAGFATGEPALVIATAEHDRAFADEIRAHGWDPDELEQSGLLTRRDADTAVASLMEGELPSPTRFETEIGALVDGIAARHPGKTPRAFGEMVDIVWARDQVNAAIALEELWNDLARAHRFSLLCAYNLDIFDVGTQLDALPAVFGAHTHALPALDAARLGAAVDHALTTIVGPIDAARIYLDVAEHVPRDSMPRGQAVLAWLSKEDAPLAQGVLELAREHYGARTR